MFRIRSFVSYALFLIPYSVPLNPPAVNKTFCANKYNFINIGLTLDDR